jgi:hypothetical protein
MGMESFRPPKVERAAPETIMNESIVYDQSSDSSLDTGETLSGDSPYKDDGATGEGVDDKASAEVGQERWNPEEAMVEYIARNEEVSQRLSTVESRLNGLHFDEETDLDETEIATLITERGALQQEKIATSANYPGDWTGLLYNRLTNPVTKEKFIARRTEAMEHMEEDPSKVSRREKPSAHYQDQIDNYDANLQIVFSKTEVGHAETFGRRGRNLGNTGNENVGAVFSDAEHNGSPLTSRQKNIIEAHEKGHCLRDFVSPYDKKEIEGTIDQNVITELNDLRKANGMERIAPTYVRNPMEIAERMSQFKNYFGLGANDTFKKQHLDYIRKHYVSDTGLDNGVSDLLYVVTPETESTFLDVINKYPI